MLPPDAEVGGLDLAEWSTRSWQWFFSLPQDVNPFFDETGEICGYGQSGRSSSWPARKEVSNGHASSRKAPTSSYRY